VSGPANVTREELIGRAREMIPTLRARAAAADAARRMPDETQRDFLEAGFYKVWRPRRFGGYEMDVGMVWELAAELGRGCGSSAWIFSNIAVHEKGMGMRPPAVQDELYGDDPDRALTCAAAPGKESRARVVEGGLMLDGVWNFASGIDQAHHVDLNVFLPREDAPPEHRFALVSKSELEIIDDWFVTGLIATGSRSVRVRERFVPERHVLASEAHRGGLTPGSAVNPAPLYKTPLWALGGKVFVGPLIGIARGALDLTLEDLGGRRSAAGVALSAQSSVQMRVAEADAEIEAAAALLARDCADAMRYAERAERPPDRERNRWRRNDAFAAQLALRAVERLHALAGARRLGADDPFQRAWRDAHAAAMQITLAWDPMAANYGRVLFGQAPADPRI
jgi:3-hydroxy-9,10-secoandrosta-1,3,5(10)-triene-9,17-dione monooxygenase